MGRIGKKFAKAQEAVAAKPQYLLPDAVAAVAKHAFAKFDETVEVAVRLGVDPKHADQMVRGTVILPHGLGGPVTGGQHQHTGGLAGAVRQVHGAADHLVGLAGVDAETHDDVNGLVELLLAGGLGDLDRGQRGVELVLVERARRLAVGLAALHVWFSLLPGRGLGEPARLCHW